MKLLNGILLAGFMATSNIFIADTSERILLFVSAFVLYLYSLDQIESLRVERAKEKMWRKRIERKKNRIEHGVQFFDLSNED